VRKIFPVRAAPPEAPEQSETSLETDMSQTIRLPLLPLRDIVVFPSMTMPLLAGRAKSLKACEDALGRDGRILLVAQRNMAVEEPLLGDLYGIGVIATLEQHLSLPDSKMKLLVRGERRAKIVNVTDDTAAFAEPLDDAAGELPPAEAQDFKLADWKLDDRPGSGTRVVELQRILEDDTLSAAERVSAASRLICRG
jgi:ATP-dependent Lon protease